MKKWLCAAAVTVGLIVAPQITDAKQFPDINHQTEMGRAIDFLSDRAVINGFQDGTFKPTERVTRGQASKMMAKLTYARTASYYACSYSRNAC